MVKYFIIILVFFAVICGGEKRQVITINEELGNIQSMKSTIDFNLGKILLEKGQDNMAVTGFLMYNADIMDGELKYSSFGSMGILELTTETELDLDFGNDWDSENANQCELYLTPKLPQKIVFDLGLGEAEIDLDEIQYNHFTLDCGLGEASINFGRKRNPLDCKTLDVNVGLGSVEINNLLNSNGTAMNFECGLGELDLDFTGEITKDVNVGASVGLGSIDILIPKGTNVTINCDKSFLSSLDVKNFDKVEDGEYKSEEFDDEKPILHFDISLGAGSAEFRWID